MSGVASLDDVTGSSSDMQCCLFTCMFVSMGFCVSLLHGLSAGDMETSGGGMAYGPGGHCVHAIHVEG